MRNDIRNKIPIVNIEKHSFVLRKAHAKFLVSVGKICNIRSYYRKENAADVSTNQELLLHVTIVLRARIFGSLVSVLNSCSGDGTFVTGNMKD